jgi:hypothetical protein
MGLLRASLALLALLAQAVKVSLAIGKINIIIPLKTQKRKKELLGIIEPFMTMRVSSRVLAFKGLCAATLCLPQEKHMPEG